MEQVERYRLEFDRLIQEESDLIFKGFQLTKDIQPNKRAKVRSRMDKLKVIAPDLCVMNPFNHDVEAEYFAPKGKNKAVLAWLEHMKPFEVRSNKINCVEVWEDIIKKYK